VKWSISCSSVGLKVEYNALYPSRKILGMNEPKSMGILIGYFGAIIAGSVQAVSPRICFLNSVSSLAYAL
jgi:hypothetical protein